MPFGLLLLVLCLVFPTYFFGLAWGFFALVADGINYRARRASFLRDLEEGRLKPMLAAVLAGLACGVLWEFWNYWSVTKWVYTVPFFESVKLFEMPALGYVGFAAFGIETMACVTLLQGIRPGRQQLMACLLALVLAFGTFFLIDRYTVFSYTAPVSETVLYRRGNAGPAGSKGGGDELWY